MPTRMDSRLVPQVRWLIRRDLVECCRLENESFEFPWTEEDFLIVLRQRNSIGMVAESREAIVGYMLYELNKSELHVLNFAVCPNHRRMSVGSCMVEKLVNKLSQQRRQSIVLEIRETNLAAQKFFGRMGFKAERVLRTHYDDTAEDAYQFRYEIAGRERCSESASNANYPLGRRHLDE